MSKPVILTFIPCYLPGYRFGGPVRTLANMVDRLGDELDFRIVTADRDSLEEEPYTEVGIDEWNSVGKAQVFYTSPRNRTIRSFAHLICETHHDVLYFNSFFHAVFTIRPLVARRFGMTPERPTILAPRGEFSKGRLRLKSWKKTPYIAVAKTLGLYRDITWHASSEYEAADIQKAMKSTAQRIFIAKNLPPVPVDVAVERTQENRAPGDPLRLCFLSRISPEKNLDYALNVLREITVPVQFDIYGVEGNKAYWKVCQDIISSLPENVVVTYKGPVEHTRVVEELAKHDVFFFPTRGENYGHVIHEALSAGCLVLISDQTPWRNLDAQEVGWDIPLNEPAKFREVLEALTTRSASELERGRRAAREYAMQVAKDKKAVSDNLKLFWDMVR